jgi:hypothetical protein
MPEIIWNFDHLSSECKLRACLLLRITFPPRLLAAKGFVRFRFVPPEFLCH